MRIISIVGARPNFMKVAPLIRAMKEYNSLKSILVHTGQHYDHEMSQIFFQDLELPQPDIHLGVGSGTHAEQTGKVMIEAEKVMADENPDLVIVVGDVNSTLAAALVAVKLHIPVAHVEAGLRSFDRTMPEEINRLLTDAISDYLFTPSPDANRNLRKEGISKEKIFCVGDVMIDSLLYNKEKAMQSPVLSEFWLSSKDYALLTLHRPSNVDSRENLAQIISAIEQVSQRISVVFPVHPRTRLRLEEFGIPIQVSVLLLPPLGYLDFLNLEMNAKFVMTDSGGIQEEATALNIPCLTLRNTTERPITVTEGTNTLVGNNATKIVGEAFNILDGNPKQGKCPNLWDGKTAERIVAVLLNK